VSLKKIISFTAICFLLVGCTTAPKLNPSLIRPWSETLDKEYPQDKVTIVSYKHGPYELFYVTAHHSTQISSDTNRAVDALFDKKKFNVLVIEPISYSYGESPAWFVEESKKGLSQDFVPGGESAWATLKANSANIPFYGGEPDHLDIYKALKAKGYPDQDVIGFYFARQIPAWIRQKEPVKNLLLKKYPDFSNSYCQRFSIQICPKLNETLAWFKSNNGHDLSIDVTNNEMGPYQNGTFTQRIAYAIDEVRNAYTLNVVQTLLEKYKKVAVVYGASHFRNLRKSFDEVLGDPSFEEIK